LAHVADWKQSNAGCFRLLSKRLDETHQCGMALVAVSL
jgi:hypothetical protein